MATRYARNHRRVRQYDKYTVVLIKWLCLLLACVITFILLISGFESRRNYNHQVALVSYYRDSCNLRKQLVASTVDMQTGKVTCTYSNPARTMFAVSDAEYIKRLHTRSRKHKQ